MCLEKQFENYGYPEISNLHCFQGFMSRGTKIKGRKNAVENLFMSNEVTYKPSFTEMMNVNANPKERKKRKKRDVPVSCYFRIISKAFILLLQCCFGVYHMLGPDLTMWLWAEGWFFSPFLEKVVTSLLPWDAHCVFGADFHVRNLFAL